MAKHSLYCCQELRTICRFINLLKSSLKQIIRWFRPSIQKSLHLVLSGGQRRRRGVAFTVIGQWFGQRHDWITRNSLHYTWGAPDLSHTELRHRTDSAVKHEFKLLFIESISHIEYTKQLFIDVCPVSMGTTCSVFSSDLLSNDENNLNQRPNRF